MAALPPPEDCQWPIKATPSLAAGAAWTTWTSLPIAWVAVSGKRERRSDAPSMTFDKLCMASCLLEPESEFAPNHRLGPPGGAGNGPATRQSWSGSFFSPLTSMP
eukprot:scaffold307182_cov48-Prasinocladus_malaysianus.AAC.1